MQRSLISNFVLTAKEVEALVLKMQGNGNNSRWDSGEGARPRPGSTASFQGWAQGQVRNFMGSLAVVKGMTWRAGGQGRLMLVPLDSLQPRSL